MISFDKPEGWRVLELGGGSSPHPLSDVRVDFPDRGVPGVTHFTCDFSRPEWSELSDEGFELVLVRNVLETVPLDTIPSVLKQVLRILKPGGKTIFLLSKTQFPPVRVTGFFSEAGFTNITSFPSDGDLGVEAQKGISTPSAQPPTKYRDQAEGPIPTPYQFAPTVVQAGGGSETHPTPHPREKGGPQPSPNPFPDPSTTYNRRYFDSYQGGGFVWDYPHNEVIYRKVMGLSPKSVLELGCARGYVLKKIQDHPPGVRTLGLDCSRHSWLTRVCDPINQRDLTLPDWPVGKREFDFALSVNFLEHVPEDRLETVLYELERVSTRGVHAITVLGGEPSADPTRCCVQTLDFWKKMFQGFGLKDHQIVDCREFGSGDLPPDFVQGDGRLKLNIGCAWTQFHHGWTNIDSIDAKSYANTFRYNFLQHDVRNGLPFSTGIVDLIFSSHMLEHLSLDESVRFLRECRRVIRPTGGIRLIVPSTDVLVSAYGKGGLGEFDEVNEACANSSSPAGKLWSLLGEGHRNFFDKEGLAHCLQEAGWQPHQASFRVTSVLSNEQTLRETSEMSYGFSLFMDASPI